MTLPRLKSILPRSLFWRTFLILIVPIILLQLLVGLVFFQRHYQRVTEQLTSGVALELRLAIAEIESAQSPQDAMRNLNEVAAPLDIAFDLDPGAISEPAVRRSAFDFTGGTLVETVQDAIKQPVAIDLVRDTRMVHIAIQTRRGTLTAAIPRSRMTVTNPHQLLVLMLTAALLLSTLAVLFLRNQVRPIHRLAEAAEAFGKGRALAFRPAGAEEVRRAGTAFVAMRGRLERQIEQRTNMLSGVSHDLRTPLTRMKLTLALMDDSEETRDLSLDVGQMEGMLDSFLDFARGDALEETQAVDPCDLARNTVGNARREGVRIELACLFDPDKGKDVQLRPVAMGRALQNLVGNAARHSTEVRLSVQLNARRLDFIVEDNGPGIAPSDYARALAPFSRLDGARNLNSSNSTGLGLSIALDVARSHGGNLELSGSPDMGGLRAVLHLPR
jgi:two-component system osmolarity sensor histidine kinase EnvZ